MGHARYGAAAALLLLTACTASAIDGTAQVAASSSAPVQTVTQAAASPPAVKVVHVGGTVQLRSDAGVERVTLLGVWRRGRDFALHFRIRNVSGVAEDGPWISATVVDSAGQEYLPAAIGGNRIPPGVLLPGSVDPGPGEQTSGWLAFGVPPHARIRGAKWQAGALGEIGRWAIP